MNVNFPTITSHEGLQNIRQTASRSWPEVTGQVTQKEVSTSYGSRGSREYHPKIKYRYSVLGTSFEHQISLGSSSSKDEAQETLDNIEESLIVRYNPENPKEHLSREEKVTTELILKSILPLVGILILGALVLFHVPISTGPP